MWRFLSALTRIPNETSAESIIRDIAALIVLSLFVLSASLGAAILGNLVVAARLQ